MSEFGFYQIDTWGDHVGAGTATDPRYCTMEGVAKLNSEQYPFTVANEFVCSRLALVLGLPVPPGVVVRTDDDRLAYVALRFGHKGERPPPVIPADVVADNPVVAAGVVSFDSWIGNLDRHAANIAYVRDVVPVTIFDHSHALFGPHRQGAADRLREQTAAAMVSGCLLPHLTAGSHFRGWSERIASVHNDTITDLCRAMLVPGGITPDESEAARTFLVHRKTRILEFLEQSKGTMPNLTDWGLV